VFIRHLQQGDNFRMQVLVFEVLLRAYCIREKKKKPDTVSDSVLRRLEAKLGGIVMQRFKEVHVRMVADEHLEPSEKLKNRLTGLCLLVDTYNDLRAEQATKDKISRLCPKYVTTRIICEATTRACVCVCRRVLHDA
jgi:hypothetical protein